MLGNCFWGIILEQYFPFALFFPLSDVLTLCLRSRMGHGHIACPSLLPFPLHGCDPLARTSIMSVIRELGNRGKTVIVSSHILEEIERITEQIVILHNGRLLALGNLHAIRGLLDKHPHRILLETESPRDLAKELITRKPIYGVRFPEEGFLEIQTGDLSAAHDILPSVIVESGIRVTAVENPDDNLESLLGYLVGGG